MAKSPPKDTPSPQELRERVVHAALHLAAIQGWDQVTLADIAYDTKLSLADLHQVIEDKFDILAALGRMIDRKMLERLGSEFEGGLDPSLSPREALFELLMERFDVLSENRDGISAILRSFRFDPKQGVMSLPHLCRSMCWILEAAQINTNGLRGAMKVTGVSLVYLKVLRVWDSDDTPDLSRTMAALDKELTRAEQWTNTFNF